jgi:hypothetical protein
MSRAGEEDIEGLRREVRQLRDRQDILDCLQRYCRGLDRLDPELIASAYHPDAVDNHYLFVGGVEAFVQHAIEVESRFLATHHAITNHTCEIDGDTAHAESYVHWFLRRRDEKTISCGGGRYLDRLERRQGQWRIAVRRLFMDFWVDLDAAAWNRDQHWFVIGSRDRQDASYQRPLTIPADVAAEIEAERKRAR